MEQKDYWLFFMEYPDGHIVCRAHGHNAVADYRTLNSFIGMKKITVNLEELEK